MDHYIGFGKYSIYFDQITTASDAQIYNRLRVRSIMSFNSVMTGETPGFDDLWRQNSIGLCKRRLILGFPPAYVGHVKLFASDLGMSPPGDHDPNVVFFYS